MKKFAYIITTFLIILVVALITGFTLYNYNIGPVSKDKELKQIVIEEGDTFSSIAPKLKEKNLIKSEFFYKLYVKTHKQEKFEVGIYDLSESMSVKEIVETISAGSNTNAHVINITFVEGKNMRYIAKTIAENTVNTEDDVFNLLKDEEYIKGLIDKYWFLTDEIQNTDIYYPLEGYLFPDTYEFLNKEVSVEEIFETLLDNTSKKLEPYRKNIEESNYTIHEIMTLASIVELEGAGSSDRAAVAGVFYNRLNTGMALGSDITGYYGAKMDDWSEGLGEHISDCNGYNTRGECVLGLPVGPVCNPGIESIVASLNPEAHDYYYFVADCSGVTHLSYTYSEHVRTVDTLVAEGNWCDN